MTALLPSPSDLQARAAERCRAFEPPPPAELPRFDRFELVEVFRNGDTIVDDSERALAKGARIQGPLELAIAEGLAALAVGDRLPELGHHLDDYAREVLDVSPRTALKLVQLARELRSRPLLREALRDGDVSLRAAQVVLPVATGDEEAYWVDRAGEETVRSLERLVAEARRGPAEQDEEWGRFTVGAKPEELATIDEALEVAGRELGPGAKRFERLEAMAQEFLSGAPGLAGDEDAGPGSSYRATAGADAGHAGDARRRAALEAENDRWSHLPAVAAWRAPELAWEELTSAAELDATLRLLAQYLRSWDDLVGYLAHHLKRSRVHLVLGFASFRHYVEERLGLPPRAVEQRAALEQRAWESPALRDARRQGLCYEKLRILARLSERDIAAWAPRARGMTVIALQRAVDDAEARHMRARGRLGSVVPRRVACLLDSAVRAVRALAGAPLAPGTCLAVVARHFLDVWGPPARPKSPSQKVRRRDDGWCMVPGCSHPAAHAHHVVFRSHGGHATALENQIAACAFHHLRCIHGGYLRVRGTAPDRLTWLLGGKPWDGTPG